MRAAAKIFVLVWIFCAATCSFAVDAGGKDVSVALFSTRALQSITLSAASPNAWTSVCAACKHIPLEQPLHVSVPMERFAGGTLRVRDERTGEERTATGLWHIRATRAGTDVVLTIPSEHYVAAVLAAEAAPDEPAQSLRALAVIARTYALNGNHFAAQSGHLSADLCDSTQCQAMRLGNVSPSVLDAVRATVGETLWIGSRRAEVFFSQNCGGITEAAGSIWPKLTAVRYLQSHPDPYCIRHGVMSWHAEIPITTFEEIARQENWHLPPQIVRINVTGRTISHRASRIIVVGRTGDSAQLSASALRFGIGRALGWNQVQSDAYDLVLRDASLVFDGRGRGHGVGLCQAGAAEMAKENASAQQILGFYFPGTTIGVTTADHSWQEVRLASINTQTTEPLTPHERTLLEQTWREAHARFKPSHETEVTVIFAPSSELFRQLTSQPGWMLASTRGNEIVLQPEAVFRNSQNSLAQTLLHEMLHVLVEKEARTQTPLWLREGLVEVLGGEAHASTTVMLTTQIESELRNPSTRAANERAHQLAGAKVATLIQRYGISAVCGWLTAGVPARAL